jgi:hypothetical protein
VARDAAGGVGRSGEDSEEQLVSEPQPGAGRRCEICQVFVPASPLDGFELGGYTASLIEHRWSAHGIPGVTRCAHCSELLSTGSLANHLSLVHNLPPPSDAQRAQYDAERRIRAEITELGAKITEVGKESTEKLDELLQELRGLRADFRPLFWTVLAAVVTAQLIYPLVTALLAAALEALRLAVQLLVRL